ncbi:N-acetylmuramoyl-L-alanine amidase AmiB [Candidatus Hoaglandella endobia]|uniref:N-acetylmuramoyl-L-alanine amidase n=1 Tax=Candidatus Hoaglandella endobia TaxID=1778263 RepID=A0A143WUQ8_9ENTR|nr:N-acetylmuramoyl-L-alanine amidase AmiB [Candidatus Hoaglandella endobia]CUX97382.1 N-acetylmuramoyl-L-alanine amidase AmiB precursor [Candidatus Hoaglandella endobia]
MTLKFRVWLALVMYLIVGKTTTATLIDIKIVNLDNQSIVNLFLKKKPIYDLFSLHNPERMVVDIYQNGKIISGLPVNFNSDNVIKRIKTSTPVDKQKSSRLVFELNRKSSIYAAIRQVGGRYNVVFTVTSPRQLAVTSRSRIKTAIQSSPPSSPTILARIPFSKPRSGLLEVGSEPVVVAIDAGHGGHDPGATGPNGLHEKNVTIAIAHKLKVLLDRDPMFKPVLTRDGNYFISVIDRSDFARKNGASVLISIHADATPNRRASGASVWVLSNQRANSEMANWLEQHEKQSELLGGAGNWLAQANPDLSQAVLDLQFSNSQRVGYDIAVKILSQLNRIGAIHKLRPEHASLGVLRSPDIPSLLVETGFISNHQEARLLGNRAYQDKIANAIHVGLRTYFLAHPLQTSPKLKNQQQVVSSAADARSANNNRSVVQSIGIMVSSDASHTVVDGETLFGITRYYGISMKSFRALNNLKKDHIWTGQRLRIPSTGILPTYAASLANVRRHKVVRGDTLTSIANKYDISIGAIRQANKIKINNLMLGQMLTIPPA